MKIYIIRKGKFEELPQIMSLTLIIKDLGYDVEVITSYSDDKTKGRFSEKNINIIDICPEFIITHSNVLSKAWYWRTFSKRVWDYVGKRDEDPLFWICTADTALILGRKLFNHRYILHIRELYDKHFFYRWQLSQYANHARCVVVPELCRAAILRSWFDLKKTPIVLPNKPFNHPLERNLKIDDENALNILKTIVNEKKIVLYQGHIGFDRDVQAVADVIQKMGDNWCFILMGQTHGKYLERLNKRNKNLIHINPIVAPFHLQVTSFARIGIVVYSWDSLNNVFCAPNKVWEYAGFGIPMICSDLPALQFLVQANKAGICVDMNDRLQIDEALNLINDNYSQFSQAALSLYNSVDIGDIIKNIINFTK